MGRDISRVDSKSIQKTQTIPCVCLSTPRVVERKKMKKHVSFLMLTTITLCGVLTFLPYKAGGAAIVATVLSQSDMVAIIVELAAGLVLDEWVEKQSRDPRNDRVDARANGAYYTSAGYRLRQKHYPGPDARFEPFEVRVRASHRNELKTDPSGNVEKLKKANVKGWLKRFEVLDQDGDKIFEWSVCGTRDKPYNKTQEEQRLRAFFDDTTLSFGTLLVDQTERWGVGSFVVYSDVSTSSAVLHPMLLSQGTYPSEVHFQKATVSYRFGNLLRTGEIKERKISLNLKVHRAENRYFRLCDDNEMLIGDPVAYGGARRWVEKSYSHACRYPHDLWLHLHPAAHVCGGQTRLVVFQERSLLPSELQ
jgi:hypothetical protein